MDNMTVLVNSCDSYSDLWEAFFKLYKKYAGTLSKCEVLLNTETKSYEYEGLNIRTLSAFPSDKKAEWGARLRYTLDNIKTEFVLVLMEDNFVRRPIDVDKIKQCVSYMVNDSNIGTFNFEPLHGVVVGAGKYPGFCTMAVDTPYRLNAQASLWRTDALKQSILDIESPWVWEIYGNLRNQKTFKYEVYHLEEDAEELIDYGYGHNKVPKNGLTHCNYGVLKGKWNVKDVDKLFKTNGIVIDYSVRGVLKFSKIDRLKKTKAFGIVRKLIAPFRKNLASINEECIRKSEENARQMMEKYVYPYINVDPATGK